MSSNKENLLVYSAIGFFAGLSFFFKGFKTLKRKRLIENTPTSKTRSVAMGLVEVCGEAVPAETILQSPFSNQDCLYYRYEIEEYRRSGKRSRWVTICNEVHGTPFYVRDDTGQVLVDPNGAEVEIPQDTRFESGLGSDPPEPIQAFL